MNPVLKYLERFVTRSEHFGKGMLFDCRTCGQCVLTHTRLVCPMTCPKQLRNGPCGGSLNEHCEVYPDRLCVWVRIHNRVDKGGTSCPILLDSPDPKLFHTSSYINLFTGKDKRARTPIPYLELPPNRKTAPVQTESGLERKLKAGKFVFTSEIRSPRGANPGMVEKQALILKDDFDAVNATAYLNGHASMPSSVASAIMVKLGVEPICQAACRDHTKTSFVSELIMNKMNGVHNVLCLTGDYYQGEPVPKQVFDLDSALMIFEARHFRETGAIHYSGDTLKEPPKPFLGGAINPFTTPQNVPIRRIKQKCAAGADFIQTQVILDMDVFKRFMKMFCDEGLDKELFLIAGLPVIISKKAFEMITGVPGVVCPDAITKRMNGAEDIVAEGIQLAREMIQEVRQIPGVNGVHLMLFGMDHTVLPRVVEGLKDETKEGE